MEANVIRDTIGDINIGLYAYPPEGKGARMPLFYEANRHLELLTKKELDAAIKNLGLLASSRLIKNIVKWQNYFGVETIGIFIPIVVELIKLVFKDWRPAMEKEKAEHWPLFLRELPLREYVRLKLGSWPGLESRQDTVLMIRKAIQETHSLVYSIRFSSRAHTADVDEVINQGWRLRDNKVEVRFWLLKFDDTMRGALAQEVEQRQKAPDEVKRLIEVGTPLHRFFKVYPKADYMMNLARLYITLKRLEDIPNVSIAFYHGTPTLRGTILESIKTAKKPRQEMSFSVFKADWPGTTDRGVKSTNSKVLNLAFDEMKKLETSPKYVDANRLQPSCKEILAAFKTQIMELDRDKRILPNCWRLVDRDSKEGKEFFLENHLALSQLISYDLDKLKE